MQVASLVLIQWYLVNRTKRRVNCHHHTAGFTLRGMTRENNPVNQPGSYPDQFDATSQPPATRDESVYITEESNSTREQPRQEPDYEPRREVARKETKEQTKVKGSFAGGTWAALIFGAFLLIVLIVFILQNQQEVEITFLQWTVHFPAAIAYLLSAITGALIMALVGGWRIIELRRQVKKASR